MTTTNSTSSIYSSSSTTSTTKAKGKSTLGKDDFLNLMIKQLKYQDPLNPADGSAYASQLAQFSSLEQLQNLNDNMTSSINANYVLTQSINNTMSATLVGKEVKMSGNSVTYSGQASGEIGYTLPANAGSVTVKIKNSAGKEIKTIKNCDLSKGDHKLSWDFTDNNGSKVANGSYTYEIEAKTSDGSSLTATAFRVGKIDAIRFTDSGAKLVVGDTEYNLSDIIEIMNPSTSSSNGDISKWLK